MSSLSTLHQHYLDHHRALLLRIVGIFRLKRGNIAVAMARQLSSRLEMTSGRLCLV